MSRKRRSRKDANPASGTDRGAARPSAKGGDLGGAGALPDRMVSWVPAALIAVVAVVYRPLSGYGFVNWDDPVYVTGNESVIAGLSWAGTAWAFTSMHGANWHPLTWLSHMLDTELFGMNPGAHHVTNVLLHAASTVLLFGWLRRITGATGRSALVAALFAVHPAHVESVAWIAERKDVLSTLFLILTLWAYTAYARAPSLRGYALVVAGFALGLMAKPMLVSVPILLLLLDVWPLGRVALGPNVQKTVTTSLAMLREKVPLFAMALASSVVTLVAQSGGGAVVTLDATPLPLRLANAVVSYVSYVGKMLWPARLAVVYPYRQDPAAWMVIGSLLVLIVVSVVAVRSVRKHPYVLVGWLWYLVTLVPVIGIVQVGAQSIADRYTYIPLVGLFFIVAWGVPELVAKTLPLRRALAIAGAATVVACAVAARLQVRHWRDDVTLWGRALAVTEGNSRAHNNFGNALNDRGRRDEAIGHYREAIRLNPRLGEARANLGISLASAGQLDEAIAEYQEALRMDRGNVTAHNGIGSALILQGKLDEASEHFREAIRVEPASAPSHNNLATVFAKQERTDEAIREFQEAVRLRPSNAAYHYNLGILLRSKGNQADARQHLEHALGLDPSYQLAQDALKTLAP